MRTPPGMNLLGPTGVVLAIIVICTQVLVVYNFRNKVASKIAEEEIDLAEEIEIVEPFDKADFEEEVVGPLEEMVKKFPEHPEHIIKKLSKKIRSEESRTKDIEKEIASLRKLIDGGANHETLEKKISEVAEGSESDNEVLSRSKRSVLKDLEKCPENPPGLLGQIYVTQEKNEVSKVLEEGSPDFIDWFGPDIRPGGAWKPENCKARQKVVLLVPYRDREWQLSVFLRHIHPVLQRQQLDYRVMVIEQTADQDFNRAALMNVGYEESKKYDDFDCLVFHDVDLLPEDDRNQYTCPSGTRTKHISVAVDKWKYRLQYREYFGGVTAMRTDLFKQINGFSNLFYGWGGEDDDLFNRIKAKNISVYRQPANIAKFTMLKHDKVEVNENLEKMMAVSKKAAEMARRNDDGLSTLKYEVLASEDRPLYTWRLVKLPKDQTPKPTRSWWESAAMKLQDTADSLVGNLAQGVADKVVENTVGKDEDMREGNKVYL